MLKISKKVLVWLLSAAMLFSCTGMTALADESTDADTTAAEDTVDGESTEDEEETALPESDHNYANSEDTTWSYTLEGATNGVYVTFDAQTKTESGYDYIYIYDGDDNEVGKYTGTELAGATVYVPTATVQIRLTSDSSANYWGFELTSVTAAEEAKHLSLIGSVDAISPVAIGAVISPVVTAVGETLTSGVDYYYSYDTSEVGTHELTVTGIGSYTGTLTASYTVYDPDDEDTLEDAPEFYDSGSATAFHTNARQTSETGTTSVTFDSLSDEYKASVTSVKLTPVDVTETADGTVTYTATDTGDAEYPNAPKEMTLTEDQYYFSGNSLYINRTDDDPVIYVMEGHEPFSYTATKWGTTYNYTYPQSQTYMVTIEADGYKTFTGTWTWYTGSAPVFSIIIDEDGNSKTTDDQTVAYSWTSEEIEELSEFANGSSQCGMTGFRTFSGEGVSLTDLLDIAGVEISETDTYLLDTTDQYGNTFTYDELFGTTRYFLSGIYDDDFSEYYNELVSSGDEAGATIELRKYLAQTAMENESTVEPRINSSYVETVISGSDLDGIEMPTAENTVYNSLVNYENQYRFFYGIEIVQEECEVTFDTNGGSEVESQTVLSHYMTSTSNTTMKSSYWANSLVIYRHADTEETDSSDTETVSTAADTITQPENPTRDGYAFVGWYTDEDCTDGNEFDFTANDGTVDQDTTLYAKWVSAVVQSDHNYADSEDKNYLYSVDGATNGIYLTFTEYTYTESGYDYISIYDADGNLVREYSGDELAGATVYVPTATVLINLTSDSSNNYWGFAVTEAWAADDTIDLSLVGSVEDIDPVLVDSTISPVVTVGSTTLTEGTDYTVTYDTSAAGETTATITGIGDYSGSITTDFYVYEEAVTITDFAISNAEHDDADEELNQTIIATITFSDDVELTADSLEGELLITIAGGDVYDTARDISYEIVDGNQLVITMVSTDWVAIYAGALVIADAGGIPGIIDGLEAVDENQTVIWETQSGRIPTGIVVTNDMIEGTSDAAASTYVNVAHKANMRGMYSFQLVSIVNGEETVIGTGTSHAHNFYTTIDEAAIASAIASTVGSYDGYTVEYTSGDTSMVITADTATKGETIAVRMVEYGAAINEAHCDTTTTAIENEKEKTATAAGSYEEVEYCTFCGEEVSRTTIYDYLVESDHNYASSEDATYTYTLDGADSGIYVTFDEQTETESGYDYLYIYDGDGNQIGFYSGTTLAGGTIYVPTATVQIRLTSDSSYNYWGFGVIAVEAVDGAIDLSEYGSVDTIGSVEKDSTVSVVVKAGGQVLTEGTDYTLSADTSTVGTCTATITGIGNYTGTLTASYYVYDEDNLLEAPEFYDSGSATAFHTLARQAGDTGTTYARFSSLSDEYKASITSITLTPVDVTEAEDGTVTYTDTDTGDLEYPYAPEKITLTGDQYYFSGNYLYLNRTEDDPVIYVMEGHEPFSYTATKWGTTYNYTYLQSQTYVVTIEADGYETFSDTWTWYTGTSSDFSIIIDEDGDDSTTDDQTVAASWTAEELDEMATFANGSSQCGMTGFRTFTTMGVSLEDLLEEAGVTLNEDDHFLLDTTDQYGNDFTYEDLFGTTRYFMGAIYDDDFADYYNELVSSDDSAGATIELRRYLAEQALENETTITPRINTSYVETTISGTDLATAELPTEENTTFNSLVSYENQFRFVYGIAIVQEDCEVTFESNGGSDVDSQTVLSHYMTATSNTTWSSSYFVNSLVIYRHADADAEEEAESTAADTITQPENPTRDGYAFVGWYTDEDCTDGNEFDFTANDGTVDQDTTLDAKWVPAVIQSDNNYANSEDVTYTYTLDGAINGIYVTFTEYTYTESGYDYILIYDEDDNLIGEYSGDELAGATVYVPTATVQVRLTSDSSANYWGFAVTDVTAAGDTIDLSLVGSVDDIDPVVDGSTIAALVTVGSTTLNEGTDYTVTYDTSPAGETQATITGKGDYSGTITADFYVYAEAVTITDFAIANAEHDDADEELNQTIIATITFSEDVVLTADTLEGELLITIAGGDVYDTARDISYEIVDGNQLVITMVSTDWVAIYAGALVIADAGGISGIIDGLEAADSSKTVIWETQSGRIPTGIVVENDMIEGTADAAASTYVEVTHKANMRGMYSYQLVSIVDGVETVIGTGTSHAHNFYTTIDEAAIASAIASTVDGYDGYTVEYTSGDTYFIVTADKAVEGETLAIRMVEYGATINEAHPSTTTEKEDGTDGSYDIVTSCSFCGELSRVTITAELAEEVKNSSYSADNYTEESYAAYDEALDALQDALHNIGRDTADEVATLIDALDEARTALVELDADYTEVEAAIAAANALNSEDYEDFSAVTAAVDAVVTGKGITEQAEVDAMAEAITAAIEALVEVTDDSGDSSGTTVVSSNGDTLVVRRGNTYYFSYSLKSGSADKVISYGKSTDEVLVGDWDGDGKDTLAV
ncbi:MAG: InlB B-repeat-containing protein, partial [Clostridiales bacterium]|nr:InlB B-repeat-containing protein [Clostridiales bacterium]